MALLVEREARLVRLRPVGEWDTGLQRELEAEILSLAAIGARAFLIDLAATHHIQYRVLPEVLGLFRQIRQLGGELAISSPDSYLLEILAAGDIPRTIPVFPSEASWLLNDPLPSPGHREAVAGRGTQRVPGGEGFWDTLYDNSSSRASPMRSTAWRNAGLSRSTGRPSRSARARPAS